MQRIRIPYMESCIIGLRQNMSQAMLQINEWDTGKPLGEIAQVAETYNVVGNEMSTN